MLLQYHFSHVYTTLHFIEFFLPPSCFHQSSTPYFINYTRYCITFQSDSIPYTLIILLRTPNC